MLFKRCFIKKNNSVIRQKLDFIGFYSLISDDNNNNSLVISKLGDEYVYDTFNKKDIDSKIIDCEKDEDLFFSLASLRDDTDKYQWFTDGHTWCYSDEDVFVIKNRQMHKANAKELLKHFKEE